MSRSTFLLFLYLCLSFANSSAQDKHFTLYNLTPLSLNPAQTGAMKGEFRAGALYRNQWRAVGKPFSTITAYADKKIFLKHFDLGVGISFLNDRTGPGRLNTISVLPSFSIQKQFGKHILVLGVQPGLVHKKINDGTYPSQYDYSTGSYNTSISNGENADIAGKAYFDLNAGFNYIFRTKKSEFQIGEALNHLTSPNESLVSSESYRLPIRFTTHLSFLHWLSEKLYIKPSGLYMSHNKASEFAINALAGYRVVYKEDIQIVTRLGLAYRNNIKNVNGDSFFQNSDAASVLAGLSWNKIDLDFAYDINVSKLSDVGRNAGAFEIALTYNNLFERKTDRISIPCRRY